MPWTSDTCTKCGETKPLSAFAADRSKSDGLKSWCKACDNERCRAYYEANRERVLKRVNAYNAEHRRAA
jgi:hypothetical protein